MKTVKYLSMLLMMVALSVSFASCEKDDEVTGGPDEPPTLENTTWTYTSKFEEDGVEYVENYTLRFGVTSATYSMEAKVIEGNQTTSSSAELDYSYTYSNNLVVLEPEDAGMAYLEGQIISEIKMILTNQSNDTVIGTFYKK